MLIGILTSAPLLARNLLRGLVSASAVIAFGLVAQGAWNFAMSSDEIGERIYCTGRFQIFKPGAAPSEGNLEFKRGDPRGNVPDAGLTWWNAQLPGSRLLVKVFQNRNKPNIAFVDLSPQGDLTQGGVQLTGEMTRETPVRIGTTQTVDGSLVRVDVECRRQ